MKQEYKIGIIGTGKIAAKMAADLKYVKDVIPYAVASRTQSAADKFAQENGFKKAYGSYQAMAEDPNVALVYIATPHNLHFENTMMCLANGKHVLCEKPFAVNGTEVRQMVHKAEEKQLFLMEALWSRFMPHIIKAKELIAEGAIGKVKLLSADFCMYPDFNPEGRLFNQSLIGGSLMDIGIYPVFLAMLLLDKPTKVQAIAGMGVTGVDYNCSITFGYQDEKLAVLHSSMQSKKGVNAIIEGENGTIIFDSPWHAPSNFTLIDKEGHETTYQFEKKGHGYHYELQEVINCLNREQLQSNVWSWNNSLELINLLDLIREKAGIIYPEHDKK